VDKGNGEVDLSLPIGVGAASFTRATIATTRNFVPHYLPTGERVTLDLDFTQQTLVPVVGSQTVTFTRSGTATRVNSSGLIETMGAVDTPRYDYDPVTLALKGLLIEESRTNLCIRSEEFDASGWTVFRSAITANATTAPNGAITADALIEDTSSVEHQVRRNIAKAASPITYTWSCYVKSIDQRNVRLYCDEGTVNGVAANFNLQTGTVQFPATAAGVGWTAIGESIQAAGNGWYRCSISFTTDSNAFVLCWVNALNSSFFTGYTGNGSSGLYMWGAQLEVGAFPTSYIPTTSASVTRGADIATISSLSGWHNAVEGTMYEESVPLTTATGTYYHSHFYVAADSENNRIGPIHVTNTSMEHAVVNGGVFQFQSTAAGVSAGSTFRSAMTWKANDFAQSCNGAAASTDAAGTLPAVDRFGIGNRGGFTPFASAHIRRIVYLPQRVSNANLATLSGSTPTLVNGPNLVQVASGVPRSHYLADGTYGGYLAEGARTNLALRSEELDSGLSWANTTATVTANVGVAPDGTTTADKLFPDNGGLGRVNHPVTISAGQTYTLSIFAKTAGLDSMILRAVDNGGGLGSAAVTYNTSTGAVESAAAVTGTWTAPSSTAEQWGNGWWRFTLTFTATTNAGDQFQFRSADNGTAGQDGFLLWGAQLEAGAFASSYIPTTTASVPRNADILSYPSANNFLSTSGSVYFESSFLHDIPNGTNFTQFSAIVDSNNFMWFFSTNGGSTLIIRDATVNQCNGGSCS
jgi:hypothetical protein